MPIFNKKVWKDFAAQYPNRRKLTQVDDDLYNVELAVGEIIEQGNKFEADQFNDLENRIENAFNNINDYIERAESAATEAESYRDDAETHKLKSEGYAVGTQNEIPVDSESPYFHNNSKYYSELTLGYKNESAEYSRNSATNAATASANASDAVSAKNAAISNKLMAEGFAIGTQNGVPVDPQSPYYHNNSKYYSEQTSKDDIRDIVNIYGAKNLLDYTEKCNTTAELNGIEFSILDDGSISASGTATSFVKFNLIDKGLTPDDTCIYIPNNTYSLSDVLVTPGCRVEIGIAFYESGSITQHLYTINLSDGNRNITVNAINNDAYISLLDIQVDDETVLNNRVFKPMLRVASISDNTYVKYAMTNAELTKRHTIEGLNNTEIHDLEDGQTTVYNESSNKWKNGYPNKVKLNKDEWGEIPGFDYYTNYYYDSNDNYAETDSQVTKISGSNPITETVQYNVPIGWSDMFIRINDSTKLNEMVGKTIEFGAVTYEYTYQNENILSLKYSVNGEVFNVFSSETGQGSSDLLFNTDGVAIQLVVPENCDYIEMHYISGNSTQVTTAGTATIGNVYAFDINENIIPDENNTSVEFNRYTNEPNSLNDNSINFIKNNKEIVVVNNLGEKTVFGKNRNTESIDDIFNIYSSKNLLPFPYQDGDTKTVGGVTFTVSQKDYLATQSGYIRVTSAIRMYGTQTNATEYVIYDQNSPYPLNKGNYKLVSRFIKQDIYGDQISGDIFITLEYYDGNTNTITVTNNNSGTFQINNSEQSGIKSIKLSTLNFTAPQSTSRDEAYAAIMICSESVEDNTYLPPTYTNFQLSEKLTNYVEKSSTSGLIKNDGTIDTNQYLTSTDISGKADKSEMSVTNGTGTDVDKVTIQLKSGTSATVLKSHQDVSSLQPKTLETPITVGGQSQTTVQNALSALASEDTGHVIEDKSGTDMTQRNGLQFAGYLETTDDSANGRTVVSDAPNTVTYDTWVNMTPQQKSGKKWLITNAPGTPVNNLQPKTLDTPVVVGGQTQTTVQSALSALAASGGGGGGHTIEDSTGTAMTQRTNLKFTGATVTDDSTNNATIVSIPNMVVLSYGHSTWNDFINAYNNNTVVYCRASSNASNPGTGSQTRLAFMAYVNNASSPTEVEFQYVRSVSSKTYDAQTDEVYIYKLNNTNGGTWVFNGNRHTSTTIKAGDGIAYSYSNDGSPTMTLSTPAIAPSFSTSTSYAVNNFVFYNGNLYKCTTAHSAGAWNANHFTQTTIGAEFQRVNYSAEEHEIGTWIDGSTLYEKTIDCGTLPNASQKLVLHNISNFKRCVDIRGYTYTTYGNTMALPIATSGMFVRIDVEPTKLNIVDNTDLSSCTETYITIRYTKTS